MFHRLRRHLCLWLRVDLPLICARLGGEVVSEFAAAGVGATSGLLASTGSGGGVL